MRRGGVLACPHHANTLKSPVLITSKAWVTWLLEQQCVLLCGIQWHRCSGCSGDSPLYRSENVQAWVIVLLVYTAPANAVDWNGPWSKGMTVAGKEFFR